MLLNRIGQIIAIGIIKFYQKYISSIKPKKVKCKFHPTCSEYGIQAIKKYGIFKGIKKTVIRLKKCNPYNRDSCIDYP